MSMIGEYSEAHLLKTAHEIFEKKIAGCVVLDEGAKDRIPKFQLTELNIGRVLGRGGFCVVSEINKITLVDGVGEERVSEGEANNQNIIQDRLFMTNNCMRLNKGKSACRYGIKIIQDKCKKDANTYINAVIDLAVEARFLSVVRHPNIIKMRAMSNVDPCATGKFFVVLDRLYDILSQRLLKWKKKDFKGLKKLIDMKGKKKNAFYTDRLTIAYDIGTALKYLHDMHVLYRDIKPDNIGFDVRGDVKIFDFGLAKEFNPDNKDANGAYNLTGDTGSPRYMAPEVFLGKPYNETADVYSFSILFWQMLALETPFDGFTMNMFKKKICILEGGVRPSCEKRSWSDELKALLRSGWGPMGNRPSMSEYTNMLRDEINRNSDDDLYDGTLDISGKSAKSLINQ